MEGWCLYQILEGGQSQTIWNERQEAGGGRCAEAAANRHRERGGGRGGREVGAAHCSRRLPPPRSSSGSRAPKWTI
jgi:hypothetical protein